MDPDQNLTLLRHRLRYLTKFEGFRTAKGFEYYRFHYYPHFYKKK